MWEPEDLIKKPINWDKPPKNREGAWHVKIRLIDPDGEEFTKTLQSIPTTRKLSERESPREIIDLDYFYDTKAHFLEDKQIPSVGVFDEVFSIWKAFGGNTCDLGSYGEETDKTTNLHQHLSRISTQKLETASQITRDAVTTHLKSASQDFQTASDSSQEARLSKFEADFKQQQSEMTNKIDTMLKAITDRIAGTLPSDTVKNPKLSTYPVLSARSYLTENPQCSTQTHEEDGDVMFIEIISKDDNSCKEEPKAEGQKIMKRKLDPRENANGVVSNFTGRIKGMHVFIGNFTYIVDFMIIEDVSSIIDPRLSQVVLGKPFVEISNMTHDPPEGVVRFTNRNNEVAYKMPHKIEQYDSLSDLVKEHTKSVYLRNEEDKRRGLEYVMSKILGFYKECLELIPEYLTRMNDEGEVT
ncbi:hypothetical protein Tco_0913736 [Tanacetum coccineum]